MAACEAQKFSGVTQDQFSGLVQKAQAAGIGISGNSGTATQSGVTMTWNYDPASQLLVIQCTDSPFFIPCATINSKVNDLVKGALS
jgi:hypothetical protein